MRTDVTFAFRLLLRATIQWLIAAAMFWNAYPFPMRIADGLISHAQALDMVLRAGLVVGCVALVAWQLSGANHRATHSSWKTAIYSGLLTAVLLSVYAAGAIAYDGYKWRVLGSANLALFSETDRLIFILEIIPAASLLAGILSLVPI